MKWTAILFSLLTLSACNAQTESDSAVQKGIYEVLDVEKYQAAISSGDVTVIDVRTPGEYQSGHIQGAMLMDVTNGSFDAKIAEIDKEQPVYIYCRSGSRSANAMRKMKAMGFTEVYDLNGGVLNWTKNGKPLVK